MNVDSDEEDIPCRARRSPARVVMLDEDAEEEEVDKDRRSSSPPMSCEGPIEVASGESCDMVGVMLDDAALKLGTEMADAAQGNQSAQVLELLSRGAMVDVVDTGYNKWTALMWAGWWGNTTVAKALLEAGANPALKDSKGCTAYDMAVHEDKVNTAAVIVGQSKAHVPSYIPK